jgi:O-antigen/teichoic acid export membrane protein
MGLLKRFGGQTAIYGLGYGLTRLLQFAFLPLYTRYLTPAEYGVLALLLITGQIAAVISQVGMGAAMFREIIYVETDRHVVESTTLFFLTAVAGAVLAIGWTLSPWLSRLMFEHADYSTLLKLTFVTSALGIVEAVLLARLRIEGRPVTYSILALARFVGGAAIMVVFLVVLNRGLQGLVEATALTAALFALVYMGILLPGFRLTFSLAVLRRMLRFGLPLIPANVFGLSMASSDRYILQHYRTTAEVGIYSLGYTIGQIVAFFVNAIQLAWPAHMFEIAKLPNAERQLARMLTYYCAVVGAISLGVSLFAEEILRVMATAEYYESARVVPWVAGASALWGLSFMVNSGLTTQDKMKYSGLLVTVVAIVNLGLNFWLIPRYGMMGAAWATLVSYALLAVVQTAANQMFWRIPYEYGMLASMGALWGATLWVAGAVAYDQLLLAVLFKLALLGAFAAMVYVLLRRNQETATT